MGWFSRKPSLAEQALELLREQTRLQAETTFALIQASQEQSKVVQGYLKLFTDAPKPELRVMSNLDEANVELRLQQKREAGNQRTESFIPVESPDDWMREVAASLDSFKSEGS